MSTTPHPISPLRQRMLDDMRMRKFGDKTQLDYMRAVRNFTKYLGRSPDTASVEDLRNYQLHLVDHGTSPASLNSAISGLKFFFNITLDRPEVMAKMQPVHLPRKLPVILSPDEVKRLSAAAGNLKHQTALALAYATGLRVSEVVDLKVGDIDSQRMTAWQRPEGSLRDALTGSAGTPARLVAGRPGAGQDVRRRLAVSGTESDPAPQCPTARSRHPRRC